MTESFSYEDTFRTGFLLGEKAGPGDVYCLCGDLESARQSLPRDLQRVLE